MTERPSEAESPPPDSPYNPIFERLVDSPTDNRHELVGLIAYSLYKRSKRQWVAKAAERRGRRPTDAELDEYTEYWTEDRLYALREEAAGALSAFAESVIADVRPRILEEALKGAFWRGVWPSMTASFFYTLVLIGVAIVLAIAGVDILGILERASTQAS